MSNNAAGKWQWSPTVLAQGDRLLAQITGRDEKAIRRGQQELAGELSERPE